MLPRSRKVNDGMRGEMARGRAPDIKMYYRLVVLTKSPTSSGVIVDVEAKIGMVRSDSSGRLLGIGYHSWLRME